MLMGRGPLVFLRLLPSDCIVHLTRRRLFAFVIAGSDIFIAFVGKLADFGEDFKSHLL